MVNERCFTTKLASVEVSEALYQATTKYSLTYSEEVSILTSLLNDCVKYLLLAERGPDRPTVAKDIDTLDNQPQNSNTQES